MFSTIDFVIAVAMGLFVSFMVVNSMRKQGKYSKTLLIATFIVCVILGVMAWFGTKYIIKFLFGAIS